MNNIVIYKKKPEWFNSKTFVTACWIMYKDNFLLVQRGRETTEPLMWGIPGGTKENNDLPVETISKEIYKKVGIELDLSKLVSMPEIYISKPGWCDFTYYMFFYKCDSIPEVKLSKKHTDYKWVTLEDMTSLNLMPGSIEKIELLKEQARIKSLFLL